VRYGELGPMTCVEFERVLPDYLEGGHTAEWQAHLSSCSSCASLLADLNFISSQARLLQEAEDPSPAVWNMLEIRLRREGLVHDGEIRELVPARSSLLEFFRRRRLAWLVPVVAALMIVTGVKLFRPAGAGDTNPVARVAAPAPATPIMSSEDQQVLNTVGARFPARQAKYRTNLEEANSYIRDAEQSIKNDPNDVYSQQLLINAYEQKQMLYDLAVNRAGEQ
jgi:hypothetical protein